jgi:predicted glycosyltransferase
MTRFLFDLGHPAHVHLFRPLIGFLKARGDEVEITIRDRGIVGPLLRTYGLSYTVASRPRTGLIGSALELLIHNWHVLVRSLKTRPNYLIGTSVSVAHVGFVLRRTSIVLNEDDADYVPLFSRITYPFATRVVTPAILRDRKAANYRPHNSYHELAYLHPDQFTPDPSILEQLGVTLGERYFVIRLVSLTAHHDVGVQGLGLPQIERLISLLKPHGKVFVNAESKLPPSLAFYAFRAPPETMHSVLAFATMLISDSQTMTMEAAVLGRPAIRSNSFVGKCSVIEDLEQRYRLAWGFTPQQFDAMLTTIAELLEDDQLDATMAERRVRLLREKDNLTQWLIEQIDREFP